MLNLLSFINGIEAQGQGKTHSISEEGSGADWNKFFWTTVVTILLALLGLVIKYLNDLYLARRKDELDRVNRQLKELYGPMNGWLISARLAYEEFYKFYPGHIEKFVEEIDSEGEEAIQAKKAVQAWVQVMTHVFVPAYLNVQEIIVSNSDLLEEDEYNDCIKVFILYALSYKVLLENWKVNDFTTYYYPRDFPMEINKYAEDRYKELKRIQRRLIGKKNRRGYKHQIQK